MEKEIIKEKVNIVKLDERTLRIIMEILKQHNEIIGINRAICQTLLNPMFRISADLSDVEWDELFRMSAKA